MKKILIVDDSSTTRSLVKKSLKDLELEIVEADDGVIGLAKATSEKFDLIISDVNMPRMKGPEMIEKIRNDENGKETTIIMLTTELDSELREEGKKLNIKLWLTKPFNSEKLQNVLKKNPFSR